MRLSLLRCFSYLGLALLVSGLAGCASMSKDECLNANWEDIGMRDGLNGAARNTFASHVEACREAGVVADPQRYRAAYERGIQRFCVPANGLEAGRRGRSYANGTCPVAQEAAFVTAYRRGQDVYRAQQEVDRVNARMRDTQYKLSAAKEDARQQALRRELRDLDQEMWRARQRLYDAERWARM